MAAGDAGKGKRGVSLGAHRDIEGLIGPSGKGDEPDDFDRPLPGFKSAHQRDQEEQERQRALRNQYRAQERKRIREENAPPAAPAQSAPRPAAGGARGARGARGRQASGSSNLGIRRTMRNASVANPTGGRLPIGLTAGTGAAGLFFGAIAYALVLSVVDYGPSGPLLWFKAKFLNEPAGSSSSASTAGPSWPPTINLAAQPGAPASPSVVSQSAATTLPSVSA